MWNRSHSSVSSYIHDFLSSVRMLKTMRMMSDSWMTCNAVASHARSFCVSVSVFVSCTRMGLSCISRHIFILCHTKSDKNRTAASFCGRFAGPPACPPHLFYHVDATVLAGYATIIDRTDVENWPGDRHDCTRAALRLAGPVDDDVATCGGRATPCRRRRRRQGGTGSGADTRGRHERVGVLLALAARRSPGLRRPLRRQRIQRLASGDGACDRHRTRSARQLHRFHVPGTCTSSTRPLTFINRC